MSYTTAREVRRYRPEMPPEAWKRPSLAPTARRKRRDAYADLADGVERYLAKNPGQDARAWAAWALRVGAGATRYEDRRAPDGTAWNVVVVVEYV